MMSRPASGRSLTPFLATSLLCSRVDGGSVAVHSGQIAENEFNYKYTNHQPTRKKRPNSTPAPGSRAHAASGMSYSSMDTPSSGPMLQQWINDKIIDKLQERADPSAARVKEMYSEVLENEETFVKDVSDYLDYSDINQLRRKELLHKKWTDQVYVPLRRALLQEVDSARYEDLVCTKQALYKQYLEHLNKKGHVFLETFDPQEYYPVALTANRPAPLKFVHPRLKDPTRHQLQSHDDEDKIIHACTYGTRYTNQDCEAARRLPLLRAARRHDSAHWLRLPFTDIGSGIRKHSQQKLKEDRNRSVPDILDWNKRPASGVGRRRGQRPESAHTDSSPSTVDQEAELVLTAPSPPPVARMPQASAA